MSLGCRMEEEKRDSSRLLFLTVGKNKDSSALAALNQNKDSLSILSPAEDEKNNRNDFLYVDLVKRDSTVFASMEEEERKFSLSSSMDRDQGDCRVVSVDKNMGGSNFLTSVLQAKGDNGVLATMEEAKGNYSLPLSMGQNKGDDSVVAHVVGNKVDYCSVIASVNQAKEGYTVLIAMPMEEQKADCTLPSFRDSSLPKDRAHADRRSKYMEV